MGLRFFKVDGPHPPLSLEGEGRKRRGEILAVVLLSFFGAVATTEARALNEVIDDYVSQGLQYNLALRSESLAVEQAQAALQEARSKYLPELSLSARYTRASGGRTIDFPIGDLLNPVYSTLNQMLVAQGRPAEFPQLENERIALIREREQDTRVVARQPLYAPAINANVRAQKALLSAGEARHAVLARELKRDITVSYLNWLKARKAVEIVSNTEALLTENLRVNQSLFNNGKITEDQPLRARAELLGVQQQLQEARDAATQAKNYVNFLLNQSFDTELEISDAPEAIAPVAVDLQSMRQAAVDNRPELNQLSHTLTAAQEQVQIAREASRPTLSLGVDAGIQGEDYGFGSDYNFATASLLLNWKFYAGGGLRAQVAQANAAARRVETEKTNAARQIELQVEQTINRYQTSMSSFGTAAARTEAAQAAFRIASRKRDEGVINQAEFIDARTTLTNAELNLNLTRFDVLVQQAELEYATASGTLPLP